MLRLKVRFFLTMLAMVVSVAAARPATAFETCQNCPSILGVTLPAPCVDVREPGSGWTFCTVTLTARLDWSCQVGEARCDLQGPPDPAWGGSNPNAPWPCYGASDPFWGITAERKSSPFDQDANSGNCLI